MTSPFTLGLNQAATYWPPGAPDGFGGRTPGAPVLIACRWQDQTSLIRDVSGEEYVSNTVVYPDRALEAKGLLAQGDHTAQTPAQAGAREIRQLGKSPSIAADVELLKVYL